MRDTQGFLREESRECPSNLHSASEDHSNPQWEALGPHFLTSTGNLRPLTLCSEPAEPLLWPQ